MICPICEFPRFTPVVGTPYHQCGNCELWYQHPFPVKRYESEAEASGDQMSDRDKAINKALADHLFTNVMLGTKGRVLDCGAKYSWIGKCFKDLDCDVVAIDGIKEVVPFSQELGISGIQFDIEQDDPQVLGKFDLIILCHVIEHFYNPIQTMHKLGQMLNPNGKMFVRCPDSDSEGISRDLNPYHYSIHPVVYRQRAVEQLLKEVGCFRLASTQPLYGQRDYILERI